MNYLTRFTQSKAYNCKYCITEILWFKDQTIKGFKRKKCKKHEA